jgi:antitoxin PrlF
MTTATLTSKGQITIPAPVREALSLTQGDRIEFVQIAPGRYEILPVVKSIKALKGRFKANRTATIEDMNRAIAEVGASAGKT